MNICALHGQNHRGSTYHITETLLAKLQEKQDCIVMEHNLKRSSPCNGCFACFINGEDKCPHFQENESIMRDMDAADVIIIDSPTYCLGMTGQLKVFMDHMAFRWMTHRPSKAMFRKVGVVISSTAGAGARSTCKSIARQMFFWGIPKVLRYPARVSAMGWDGVDDRIKKNISYDMYVLSERISKEVGNVRPGIRTKLVFNVMRAMMKKNNWLERDREYWQSNGWLDRERPWR